MPVSNSDLLYDDFLSTPPNTREEMLAILRSFDSIGFEFSLLGPQAHVFIGIPNNSTPEMIGLAHKVAAAKPLTDMIRGWLLMQRWVQRVRAEDLEAAAGGAS